MITNLEALHVMITDLKTVVAEIKEDGKKTLEQALKTNGRVTANDFAIKTLEKDHADDTKALREEIAEQKRKQTKLIDWILRGLIAAAGAGSLLQQIPDFIKWFKT